MAPLAIWLAILIVHGESPPERTAGVEIRLIADTTTWSLESNDVILVELRNPNAFPVVVPGPEWGRESLTVILTTPEEDLRLNDGVACRWGRRVSTVIPPRTAIHLAYSTRLCTWPAREQLPFEGELRVTLVANPAFLAGELDRITPGAVPVAGEFEARLACRVLLNEEPLIGAFRRPHDQAVAREFLGSVARRKYDASLLEVYEELLGRTPSHASFRCRVDELRGRSTTIRHDEIRELERKIPTCSILDDVWYRFALHHYWDERTDVRRELLSILIHERPGSTGATRAEAWLAWPPGYEDPIVSDSWAEVVPPGGPLGDRGAAPARRNPYESASNSGQDPW